MSKAIVKSVDPCSIAEDCGVEKGDTILKINDKEFLDVLDFRYLTSDEYYTVEILKKDGSTEVIEVYNDLFEQFGCEFENSLMDEPKTCRNKCIFCFMDQLPHGMRDTMYFKDDDVRLSFLEGNYVTLTNLSEADIDRICSLRVSPVNISVHTTDSDLRCTMLGNRFAGKLMSVMERFKDAGIKMNTQIVLCKGINDGAHLKKTIFDLSKLYPSVASISVVPVGITGYRDGLYPLESFEAEDCKKVIKEADEYRRELSQTLGTSLVYLADEFYIKSGTELPLSEYYDDFPQIENGVGLMRTFIDEIDECLKNDISCAVPCNKSIATSEIAYDYINEAVCKIKQKSPDFNVNVYKIKNNYFGGKITVTGLLCGQDIISQLEGEELGEYLVLSSAMFKDDMPVLLDDVTADDIEAKLGVKVIICDNNGMDFVDAVLR